MNDSARLFLAVGALLLLCGATYLLVKNNEEKGTAFLEPTLETYLNETYGFSFQYDAAYEAVEYADRYVTIEKEGDEPNEIVNLSVEEAEEDATYESFQAFAYDRSKVYCAADGPRESFSCTQVSRTQPFTTATGLRGDIYYLNLEHTTETGTSEREAGPFYAFDITNGTGGFRGLIVRPARFHEESSMYDEGAKASNDIVNTLLVQEPTSP